MAPPAFGRPPALGPPGQKPPMAPPAPKVATSPSAGESQGDENIPPNPEAVDYRTEAETCGHCSFYSQDFCQHPIVAQAVAAGDSCAAFEASGGKETAAPTGMPESSEPSEPTQ